MITNNEKKQGFFCIDTKTESKPLDPGLYIISTPIGNLEDITLRALRILSKVDIVACEDTRLTSILMNRYGIQSKLCPYNEHNSYKMVKYLLSVLQEGSTIALVSDAGTPLISDPGHHLVCLAIKQGYKVIPIPGASAPLAALVVSGLPNDSFFFTGFLPSKHQLRRNILSSLISIPSTLVLFESPRRLGETLNDAAEILGKERPAAVCREMTKIYEEFQRNTLANLADMYRQKMQVKGEIVIVIAPPDKNQHTLNEEELDKLLLSFCQKMPKSQAASQVARITGIPRKQLYSLLLKKDSINAS